MPYRQQANKPGSTSRLYTATARRPFNNLAIGRTLDAWPQETRCPV